MALTADQLAIMARLGIIPPQPGQNVMEYLTYFIGRTVEILDSSASGLTFPAEQAVTKPKPRKPAPEIISKPSIPEPMMDDGE